ncbi:MAG TPA: hypothetical protein VME40_14140, partial [Caulobacteraceae bacterium]|nr:hypothetical protein [Caulobacteraceae bacterium]
MSERARANAGADEEPHRRTGAPPSAAGGSDAPATAFGGSAPAAARQVSPLAAARRRRNRLKAYLFVSPAMVLFVAFIGLPFVGIVVFSFLQWDLLTPPTFAGLANYRLLIHDGDLANALVNSLLFDLMTTSL